MVLILFVDDANSTHVHWYTKINRPPRFVWDTGMCTRFSSQISIDGVWSHSKPGPSTVLNGRPQ